MTTLIRTRLIGYLRSQAALGPALGALVLFGLIYSGGAGPAAQSFGGAGLAVFALHAWQTKALLDVEPDIQRQLARVAVGARTEWLAGLLAALLLGVAAVPVLVLGPIVLGLVTLPDGFGPALGAGLWLHLVAVPPAVALGAWASRAVTERLGVGIIALVGGMTAAVVLAQAGAPFAWLAPPLLSAARVGRAAFSVGAVGGVVLHAVVWAGLMLAGYVALRRRRA